MGPLNRHLLSMELDRGFPGHTLTVVLIGHAMPDLPYNVPLRVRCSWDHQNYWVGTAKLSSHEVSGEPDPFQRIILQGVFEREEPS